MKLTESLKKEIDGMGYESMLSQWRFAPVGTSMFQGESGDYFSKVMAQKRKSADCVKVSKDIGGKSMLESCQSDQNKSPFTFILKVV